MSEPSRAERKPQRSLSPIWIVPLVAILIGIWMIYDNFSKLGPSITLITDNAEGIEAGKTLIKTRNVEVGRVEKVNLSDNLQHAVITARMSPQAEDMLNADTRFWVVKPRIGREGISGLNTVLSGAYIQLLPGSSEEGNRRFEMLDQPPVAPPDAAGIRINLISQAGNAISAGDPVSYQGFTVGRVEHSEFDTEQREMKLRLYIQAPYDSLITTNTRFWSSAGVDMRLDSRGIRVKVGSLESLVGGGITFGVPDNTPMGSKANANATYTLFADEESANEGSFEQYLEYVLLVDDTVRGLQPGAPVEYRGVRIGTVVRVPWNFTAPQPNSLNRFAIPVLIRIEPQRFDNSTQTIDVDEWYARMERMFGHGLRASLKAGNLLTGALFVDLNFHKDVPPFTALSFVDTQVFPTTTGGFAQIEQKVSNLLDKFNNLKIEPVVDNLNKTLAATQQTMEKVNHIAASVDKLLADPATGELPASVNQTLRQLNDALEGFSPDSEGYNELTKSLARFEKLMADMQPVLRTLNDQPNALIFDREPTQDPQPKAAR
ncbi:intermembrane transport protein PqiB [Oceanimonas baumannii]|uniref:Mammalian cell entry protein n=1 Tax=Oceanimonas baumannii TaxID=129578 RepID=A0A235C9P6_9GAMM|nr:intermembrane transport protein PqiB [Oceanimonas baumannii]OYD21212.1 mammalian cell entry protein [Oceanimonas baumannii]TDW55287.1 paraquat-inducible protein B [Oceanimonas baumannii]